jgi:hypothetical protein
LNRSTKVRTSLYNGCFLTIMYMSDIVCIQFCLKQPVAWCMYIKYLWDLICLVCYVCYSMFDKSNVFILAYSHAVNFQWNVGETSECASNSGKAFACKGWHLSSIWSQVEGVMYVWYEHL